MAETWLVAAGRKGSALVWPIFGNILLVGLALAFVVVVGGSQCTEGSRFEPPQCGVGFLPFVLVIAAGALRIASVILAHKFLLGRRLALALGGARAAANGFIAAAIVVSLLPPDVAQVCTNAAGLCFTPPALAAAAGLAVGLVTLAAAALRKPEEAPKPAAGGAKASEDGPVLEEEDATRNVARDLLIPITGLLAVGIAAGGYLATTGKMLVLAGVAAAVACRIAARFVFYFRKPAKFFPVVVGVIRGAGFGFLGVLTLLEFVPDGPGMPLSAWQLGLFILCFSVIRQAKTLVKGPGLPILATLLLAMGGGAWGGYNAYRYLIGSLPLPFTGQLLWLAAVGYLAACVRALLAFAGEDEAGKGASWADWARANFWRNLVFVGLLIAYLVFRDDIAYYVPFFPIIEFSLGMMVLGFVLTRVRTRIRATLTEAPTAADWKRHVQRVERVSEAEHDQVHEVLGAFLTTGARRDEYADVFTKAARVEGDAAKSLVLPVSEFRDTRKVGHLPYVASLAAALVFATGITIALFVLIDNATPEGSQIVGIGPFGLSIAGVAVWFTQIPARRVESVVGLATSGILGVALVAASLYGYYLDGIGPGAALASPSLLAIVAVLLAGLAAIPGYRAWALSRAIRAGSIARDETPRESKARAGFRRQAKFLVLWIVAAFVITFPITVALEFLDSRDITPDGLPSAYANIQASLLVLFGAAALASLALMLGYAVARPLVAREDAQNRARRHELHASMMRAVGVASGSTAPPVLPTAAPATPARAAAVTSIFSFGRERT